MRTHPPSTSRYVWVCGSIELLREFPHHSLRDATDTLLSTPAQAIVYTGGRISGGHFNPAVSLAVFASGQCAGTSPPLAAQEHAQHALTRTRRTRPRTSPYAHAHPAHVRQPAHTPLMYLSARARTHAPTRIRSPPYPLARALPTTHAHARTVGATGSMGGTPMLLLWWLAQCAGGLIGAVTGFWLTGEGVAPAPQPCLGNPTEVYSTVRVLPRRSLSAGQRANAALSCQTPGSRRSSLRCDDRMLPPAPA